MSSMRGVHILHIHTYLSKRLSFRPLATIRFGSSADSVDCITGVSPVLGATRLEIFGFLHCRAIRTGGMPVIRQPHSFSPPARCTRLKSHNILFVFIRAHSWFPALHPRVAASSSALRSVFFNSMATVIGPTPLGTGLNRLAIG